MAVVVVVVVVGVDVGVVVVVEVDSVGSNNFESNDGHRPSNLVRRRP